MTQKNKSILVLFFNQLSLNYEQLNFKFMKKKI